jgi:hypothetical protein
MNPGLSMVSYSIWVAKPNTRDREASGEQKFISQSGDWEIQDEGTS